MKTILEYTEELQRLHHRRVNIILPTGAMLLLFLAILDYVALPHLFTEFLLYRELLMILALGLLILNSQDKQYKYPLTIGFIFYLAASAFILIAITKTGGVNSPYYVGLMLAMTVYTALAPLTLLQTLNVCFTVVIFYGLTLWHLHPIRQPFIIEFFSNLFFLVSLTLIVATQSWVHTRLRKREYHLRMQERDATTDLHQHARNLQEEVERRSRERTKTEERHRLLFDQIADTALVITPEGIIIESNKAFQSHFFPERGGSVRSIYDIALRRERHNLRHNLKEMIKTEQPLSGYRVSLIKRDLTVAETEINASLVTTRHGSQTILMLIRDITTRKELEKMLISSLQAKKKTESAAIMALAKLSEFRDLTSGHHLERIREYCTILATELAEHSELNEVISPAYIEDIYHASILHDIGKVAIPDDLLNSVGTLSEQDMELVRRHTIIGGDVIRDMEQESENSGFLAMAKHIAYFHHERWDGKGYPYGLTAREIPLAARIMALADRYEQITVKGSRSEVMSHKKAASTILQESGTRFDPMVVDAFIARQAEMNGVRTSLL